MKRTDNGYRAWRRKRAPRPRFPPNDSYMREYEETIILADCRRLTGVISAKALRQQEPGRYSVKLYVVLVRMSRTHRLKPVGREWSKGRIMPLYELPDHTKEAAA